MPSIRKEGSAIGVAAGRLGDALKTSFTPAGWKAAGEEAKLVAQEAASVASKGSGFGSKWNPLMWGPLTGLWIAKQPIAIAMKPAKWGLNFVAATFEKFPRAMPVLALGAAAVAAGSWFSKRGSQNLQAQGEAVQQMQIAQAMGSQPQQSYMNSVSPDESAMLAAMQKQGSEQGGSKAEAVMAARKPIDGPEMATANIAAI